MQYYKIRHPDKKHNKYTWQVFINKTNLCWEYLKEFKTLKEARQFIRDNK